MTRTGGLCALVAGLMLLAVLPAAASTGSTACQVTDPHQQNQTVYGSLQPAVDAAAAGDRLIVSGICFGTTVISKDLMVAGQGSGTTKTATLDGFPGIRLTIGAGVSVTLDSLTITHGYAPFVGGIWNQGGTLTLNDCVVRDNFATNILAEGGGILNQGGKVTLNTSSVFYNSAAVGGGIFNADGTLTLNNSSVFGNDTGLGGIGGGIVNADGTLTLSDSHVYNNAANTLGGGIFNSLYGTLTMTGKSSISNNIAGNHGGGIYNAGGSMNGAITGKGGNVYGNTPDDIYTS